MTTRLLLLSCLAATSALAQRNVIVDQPGSVSMPSGDDGQGSSVQQALPP